MGLDNRERLTDTLELMLDLAYELDPSDRFVWEDKDDFQHLLDEIGDHIAQTTGWIVQKLETNTAYRVLGESKNSFRGLKLEYFNGQAHSVLSLMYDEGLDSFEYDHRHFAQMLGFPEKVQNLGRWWDLWRYVGAILYRVNRYQDNLFPTDFHRHLNRVFFSLLKLRRYFEVEQNTEDVLLFKYFVYENERTQERSDDYMRNLASMTQEELSDKVREIQVKEHEKEIARNNARTPKIDPVVGDKQTASTKLREVTRTVKDLCGVYPPRRQVLLALLRTNEDVAEATQVVSELLQKMLAHPKGYHAATLCKRCEMVVLGARNKSGLCRKCYRTEKTTKKKFEE